MSVTISLTMLSKRICDFVLSRIDYCRSFRDVCPKHLIYNLQNCCPPHLSFCHVWPHNYLRSFVFYTGLLSNPVFSTKVLFLPLNHWTTKPLPISLISSSCMFRLTNSYLLPILYSFVFHQLTSNLLVDAPFFFYDYHAPLLSQTLFFHSII